MSTNYTVLDFESYYNSKQGYTLRKMTPVEYLLDPRFECTGCSVIEGDEGVPFWLDGAGLVSYLRRLRQQQREGRKLVVLSHNNLFDMCLLVWRFGLVPDLMIDTMGMAQALLFPKLGYVSLAKVSEHLGLSAKGDTILKVDGMTGDMIRAAGLWEKYKAYAIQDAVLCREIYKILRTRFPAQEFLTMDTVTRCAAKPKFKLDTNVLAEHLADVKAAKVQLLAECGLTADANGKCKELMSNEKFAELLREQGIEPEMKVSPTTGELTYAFAKSDQFMADLEEHDDPSVQALVAARLGFKSTLEETRTERLLSIARQRWVHDPDGGYWAPVPLKYSGAHTHRLSGQWKLNMQNFPRGGKLRQALVAPEGHVIIACDASQIEARIAAWLAALVCGEHSELVDAFARGDDVYSLFATEHIYKRLITKADTKERFVGKQAILGLGFGMGKDRYAIQVRKDSRLQLKVEIILSPEEADRIVRGYRFGMAPAVPKAWKILNNSLPTLQSHDSGFQFGPMTYRRQEIIGPTGLPLFYPELHQEVTSKGNEWRFKSGRMTKRLFGGKLYENIVQHLARCCNIETALKVRKQFGVELALQAHDELVYVVPGGIEYYMEEGKRKYHLSGFAAEFKPALQAIMSERPSWGLTLPLAAESGAGLNYGDAK